LFNYDILYEHHVEVGYVYDVLEARARYISRIGEERIKIKATSM
jgi:hypothetical protein